MVHLYNLNATLYGKRDFDMGQYPRLPMGIQ